MITISLVHPTGYVATVACLLLGCASGRKEMAEVTRIELPYARSGVTKVPLHLSDRMSVITTAIDIQAEESILSVQASISYDRAIAADANTAPFELEADDVTDGVLTSCAPGWPMPDDGRDCVVQLRIEMFEQAARRVPLVIRVRGNAKPLGVDLYLRWQQSSERIKVTPGDMIAPDQSSEGEDKGQPSNDRLR